MVLNQVLGVYQYKHPRLTEYQEKVLSLLEQITDVSIEYVLRENYNEANELAQHTSGYKKQDTFQNSILNNGIIGIICFR